MKRTIGIFLANRPRVGTLHYDAQGRREAGRDVMAATLRKLAAALNEVAVSRIFKQSDTGSVSRDEQPP